MSTDRETTRAVRSWLDDGVTKLPDRVLDLPELTVEPGLELRKRNVGDMLIVEDREGQTELGAELIERQLLPLCLGQNIVGGFPDRGKVIHQCA